jgi:hypothetical protein
MLEDFHGVSRCLLVARAAGVGHDRGHVAEVRPVGHCGLYADLRDDAHDGERDEPKSRIAVSRKVPEKALMAIFSETAPLGSGSSSGTIWE